MLIFVHIPKNAGTTINSILRRNFGSRHREFYTQRKGKFLTAKELEKLIKNNSNGQSLAGHDIRPTKELLENCKYQWITFLRHPLQRALSLYQYEKKTTKGTNHCSQLDFDAYVKVRIKEDNALTGFQTLNIDKSGNSKQAIKKLDKFLLVGLVEQFDESLLLLRKKLGRDFKINYLKKNVGQVGLKPPVLSLKTKKWLLRNNKNDLVLYHYAKKRLLKELKKYGLSFYFDKLVIKMKNKVIYSSEYLRLIKKKAIGWLLLGMSKEVCFLKAVKKLIDKKIWLLDSLMAFLKQDECQKYKDCLLLFKLKRQQPPASDRYIEYPWMIENIGLKKGRLLDVGSTSAGLLYDFLAKQIKIYGINLNEQKAVNNKLQLIKADIIKTEFANNFFDCITCISVLEHIGVKGRYKSDHDSKGDLKAMREIRRILKKGGTLLVTLPYGRKDVLPINKLYNRERIKKLFKGFKIINQDFVKFNKKWGYWFKVKEKEAAKTDMFKDCWYAIGLIKAVKR